MERVYVEASSLLENRNKDMIRIIVEQYSRAYSFYLHHAMYLQPIPLEAAGETQGSRDSTLPNPLHCKSRALAA